MPGVSLYLKGLGGRQGPPATADAENARYFLGLCLTVQPRSHSLAHPVIL